LQQRKKKKKKRKKKGKRKEKVPRSSLDKVVEVATGEGDLVLPYEFRQPGTWSAIVILAFGVCCLTVVDQEEQSANSQVLWKVSASMFGSSRESFSRCSSLMARHHFIRRIELNVSTSPTDITAESQAQRRRKSIEGVNDIICPS
ncbi:hypothetical protein KCU83_g577, partial [Aureobasidium melanogenum]